MRLAVFTNMYPAQTATFFERDLRSLLDAGVDLDVFAIYPHDESMWQFSSGLLEHPRMSRRQVHHIGGARESLARARPTFRQRPALCLRDAARTLASAAIRGPMAVAKTAYVLPQAWAWAAEHAGRYDHVLAYWGNYPGTCAYAFHRLDGRPIPFTLWLHAGVDLYGSQAFLRQKLLYADNVLTCCEFNRGFILRRFPDLVPRLAERLHVCHHGLELSEFPFRPDGRPANRLAAVGRLASNKGFDDLLMAVNILDSQGIDVTLDLVGDGPERKALGALAGDLGIAARVRFTGWLKFSEARDAMSQVTALVHPSDELGDGLPNVVREAMALGTPVVGTRVAGLPDALEDGCGVLVPPRNPAALADAIAGLLRDSRARQEIAFRARRRVEERYDVRQNGAWLAALLAATRRGGEAASAERPARAWASHPAEVS